MTQPPPSAPPPSESSSATGPRPERILIKYAVLVGLTPLIPIPLLDDLAQGYFERRMIEKLAGARHLTLSPEHLNALASPPTTAASWLRGCFTTLLLYPISKLLRKLFFFLEIKRALDLVAVTYVRGYLLDRTFGRALLAPPGPHAPAAVREATEQAITRVGTSPIGLALRGSFRDSGALVARLAEQLFTSLRRLPSQAGRAQVAAAARAVEDTASADLQGAEARVEQGIKDVPPGHFERLEAALDEELTRAATGR